jgi:hypothetical protein
MNSHSGGFIDGDDVVIFKEYRERDGLRNSAQGRRRLGLDPHTFAGPQAVIGLDLGVQRLRLAVGSGDGRALNARFALLD